MASFKSQERDNLRKIERTIDRIDIAAYGSIGIEAPTKEDCLDLFKEVTVPGDIQTLTKQ